MSVDYELQKAVVTTLKGNVGVTAKVGGRVYDRVPPSAAMPYVHLRSLQVIDDSADCLDGTEIFVEIDVWSNAVGKPEASQAAGAIRKALHGAGFVLPDPYALVDIEHQDTTVADEDGDLLTRARMTFRALLETVAF